MPYIENDVLLEARRVDLLTYLQQNDPGNLVHISGNNYCTRDHDSLKISNGKWYWFSRGFGGVSAVDYLIKVQNYTLPQAVEAVMGRAMTTPSFSYALRPEEPKKLLMPCRGGLWNNINSRSRKGDTLKLYICPTCTSLPL